MASATYDTVIHEVQQLTREEQARLRDELDTILANRTPSVRPGLKDDLEALDTLAAKIGAAWKTDRSAAETVSDMRREL